MLKTILYLLGGLIGIGLTLRAPFWGAVTNIGVYLLNPELVASELPGFRYQFFSVAALIFAVLISSPKPLAAAGKEGRILWLLWAYVGLIFLSVCWAVHSGATALDKAYDFSKTVLVTSLFLFVIRSKKEMSLIVWACLLGATHGAFMHVIGSRIGYIPPSRGAPGHEDGAFIEYQAPILSVFLPLFVLQAIYAERWYGRLFCLGALPLVLNSIANTYMRTAFVGIAFQVVLLLVFLPLRISLKLTPLVVLSLVVFVVRMTPEAYWDRMATITAPTEEASANSRLAVAEASLKMLQDHPFGVGYWNYSDVSPSYLDVRWLTWREGGLKRSAHNSYIAVLCDTGVIGFSCWMGAVLGTLWLYRGLRKDVPPTHLSQLDVYALGFEIGLYGWLVEGLTQSLHELDPVYWVMVFGIVIKRLKHKEYYDEQNARDDP